MRKVLAAVAVIAIAVAAAVGWQHYAGTRDGAGADDPEEVVEGDWLTHLYSQNPKVAEAAARQLKTLGAEAVPEIKAVLQDPAADVQRKKSALKAAGQLGPLAAPAVGDVADQLPDPRLTAEAAVALSFMGRDAFPPLRDAVDSDDPVIRREALRSIGKLRERAPLDSRAVIPLLLEGMEDPDAGVRTVAATYLGIIGQDPGTVVPVLIDALKDDEAEVRTAAATALGSFHGAAATVIPALRRATGDKNADVAREAGVALVKLQGTGSK